MCGIAGIVNFNSVPVEKGIIKRMIKVVNHRGPDSEGIFYKDNIALGHVRLAILDLSDEGNQPMKYLGRYVIVHNGEIYNYKELKEELIRMGYVFQSKTDTEVILAAFDAWGTDAFKRFLGMWAFAIFDMGEKVLILSRDRFGIKPLHYYWDNRIFVFASEVKQLLETPYVSSQLNRSVLADFFLWNFENHTNETFFENIKNIPPGHYLKLDLKKTHKGITPNLIKYWRPDHQNKLDEKEAIIEFKRILSDAVRLRLRSDVPLGITLSGGLDSSSVITLASFYASGNLLAFNVDYKIKNYSEKVYALSAAKKARAKLITISPTYIDLSKNWEEFIWHIEQPIPALTYFSNFEIYRLISEQGVKVVLSGQGGDELLLGYERYRVIVMLNWIKSGKILRMIKEVFNAARLRSMPMYKQFLYFLYFTFPNIRIYRRLKLVSHFINKDFVNEFVKRGKKYLRESMKYKNWVDFQNLEMFRFQLPHLLHHEDRMSMAHSVETRLPFLDHRLYELIHKISLDLLYRNGYSKYILRESLKGILPEEVRLRKDKMGYETPTGMLIRANKDFFIPLLQRHEGDKIVNTKQVIENFDNPQFDERILCSILSYLTWKEVFNLRND